MRYLRKSAVLAAAAAWIAVPYCAQAEEPSIVAARDIGRVVSLIDPWYQVPYGTQSPGRSAYGGVRLSR